MTDRGRRLVSSARGPALHAGLASCFLPLALVLLAGCGQKDSDAGPGGVSVGEARALDQAAAMLEQQRLPPNALASGTPAPRPGASPQPPPPPSR